MENLTASGYAPVNGLNMYYEIYGSGGTPLVLIHGGGSTIEVTFGSMLPLLSGHLIAVELQAHGRTSDRDAPESFEQDADDVAGLLAHLKIDKANVLGFSNGGSTAMQVAIRHPQLVNKLVVISGAYQREGFIPGFFNGFENITLNMMPDFLKTAFLKVTPDEALLLNMFNKDVQRMATFKDWSDDSLRGITAPALIINGDQDVMLPQHALKIASLIPGARVAILPANHATLIGELGSNDSGSKVYQQTVALINGFLNG